MTRRRVLERLSINRLRPIFGILSVGDAGVTLLQNQSTYRNIKFVNMKPLVSAVSLSCIIASGCVSMTIAPTVDPAKVKQIAIGQSKSQIEQLFGQKAATFTLRAKPHVQLQTWQYIELSDVKCLMVSYDAKEVVVDYEIIVKDRGRGAMPVPGGC